MGSCELTPFPSKDDLTVSNTLPHTSKSGPTMNSAKPCVYKCVCVFVCVCVCVFTCVCVCASVCMACMVRKRVYKLTEL